jgi:tRNA-specific 2-thiouridylase
MLYGTPMQTEVVDPQASPALVPGKVLVAMSGGVDSSVAAALLAQQGWQVVGVAMRLYSYPQEAESDGRTCCAPDDLYDARRVAARMNFPFYVTNAQEQFRERVVQPFIDDYLAGRTPSPCVRCNDHLKFDLLFKRMEALDLDRLATGHYARIDQAADGRFRLLRATSVERDQSYFLFGLGQAQLAKLLFPIGHLHKPRVREIAVEIGLSTAHKPDSMDICFVGAEGGDASAFVEKYAGGARPAPGEIVDDAGKLLATHDGIHNYTVGQRRKLGVFAPVPLYVKSIDAATRRVVVAARDEATRSTFSLHDVRFVAGAPPPPTRELLVRVRHRHEGVAGTVHATADGAAVQLAAPTLGVAPGQAAVFYEGEEVVGGGWIV